MKVAANKKGFTLIEIVVSLVLIAIFVSIAGLGLVKIMQGYLFTRQNSATIQEAQIAMARIVKELGYATVINSQTASSVNYTRPTSDSDSTPVTNTITLSGNTVQINSDTLINNVTSFTLAYHDALGNTTGTSANIRRVDVALTATAANNYAAAFTNSIYIRESYF